MPDREDDGRGHRGDRPQVMRETEHGPVVADRAEARVERVGELAVIDELCADGDVAAGLVGRAEGLIQCQCRIGHEIETEMR